jgi:hypothetical protein
MAGPGELGAAAQAQFQNGLPTRPPLTGDARARLGLALRKLRGSSDKAQGKAAQEVNEIVQAYAGAAAAAAAAGAIPLLVGCLQAGSNGRQLQACEEALLALQPSSSAPLGRMPLRRTRRAPAPSSWDFWPARPRTHSCACRRSSCSK